MKLYYILFGIVLMLNSCESDKNKLYSIEGEPFTFKDKECKKFENNNKPISIKSVYTYEALENKKFYLEEIDYKFDKVNSEICRTEKSSLPNFKYYKVNTNTTGKFEFQQDPRNPSRVIPFQVFIDYNYKDDLTFILSKKFLPNEFFKKELKVVLVGDSIFASADTISQYFSNNREKDHFMAYISENFMNLYRNKIKTVNLSEGGKSLEYLKLNILNIIQENPDVVILGFGMNDHILGNILGQKEFFFDTYNLVIEQLKSNNINNIILIGFPQQNIKWDKEDEIQTKIYNNLIKEVANKNKVEFIDMYTVFNEIKNKNLNEDIYGDYMHHPSSFGHKIYFSALMPYFLRDNILDDKLINYIKIKEFRE